MKVIIAGSRDVDEAAAYFAIGVCIGRLAKKGVHVKEIVSGGARGVDTYAIAIAKQYNYGLKVFPADWDKHGKRAGYLRNVEMAEYADALIAIWDGRSPGTKMMIDIAKKKDMPMEVEIINYVPKDEI